MRQFIREIVVSNLSGGGERITNELLLKVGIHVSPRTVRKYMPAGRSRGPRGDQLWSMFVRNYAKAIVACDFCVAVTATFRLLLISVVIEHGSRRLLHCNVTGDPSAEWTLQQLREAIPSDHSYRFMIHDRDNIFSAPLDCSVSRMGLHALKTPYRSPLANLLCERAIGSMRRECPDYLIPLNESHLRGLEKDWTSYYNCSRVHSALRPGVPDASLQLPVPLQSSRHRLSRTGRVIARPVLGGLHHDYMLAAA